MNFMGKPKGWWLEHFDFDLERGKIYRKTLYRSSREAFNTLGPLGYLEGQFKGIRTYAHRLLYFIGTGTEPKEVDHINGNRSDNRLVNLREVSRKENARNSACKSPVVGVGWDKSRGKWRAQIMVDGKGVFLGRYTCFGKAVVSRMEANQKFGFHINHGRKVNEDYK
jgi:hypothetical protein